MDCDNKQRIKEMRRILDLYDFKYINTSDGRVYMLHEKAITDIAEKFAKRKTIPLQTVVREKIAKVVANPDTAFTLITKTITSDIDVPEGEIWVYNENKVIRKFRIV